MNIAMRSPTDAPHDEPLIGAPVLDVRQLAVQYGGRSVLKGLDLSVVPGQVIGLLGRNGAGKTTLLESLLGLREVDGGEVRLFGTPLAAMDDDVRSRIGYVPQRSDLFGWMTARQLLGYFKGFYPRWNAALVDGLLSRWQIDQATPISRLSGGEQQRLSIIRALAHQPELLVLDEPVASLDPAGRRDFLSELVYQVLDRGTTVVFSTHILSDLERVAFHVAFLTGGRITLQVPLEQLKDEVRRVTGPADVLEAAAASARWQWLGRPAAVPGTNWHQGLARAGDDAWRQPLAAGLRAEPVGFEDLFVELTQ